MASDAPTAAHIRIEIRSVRPQCALFGAREIMSLANM
jgi:hypothetical protein